MKKSVFILSFIVFILAGCHIDPVPNPGFRAATLVRTTGDLPKPLRQTSTEGDYEQPISYPPTGDVTDFDEFTGNSFLFDVDRGKAPGLWYVQAHSGWLECEGQSAFIEFYPGTITEITCFRGVIYFPLAPSVIYNNSGAIEIKATLNGVHTNNGMPIFQFENYAGQLIAVTQATEVNGYTVKASSSCLIGKPIGTYTVKVYNASENQTTPIGISQISIRGERIDPCGIDLDRPNCPH